MHWFLPVQKKKINTKILPSLKSLLNQIALNALFRGICTWDISPQHCQRQTKLFRKPWTSHLLQWLPLGRRDESHREVSAPFSLLSALSSQFSFSNNLWATVSTKVEDTVGCWLSVPFTFYNYIADCAFLKRS